MVGTGPCSVLRYGPRQYWLGTEREAKRYSRRVHRKLKRLGGRGTRLALLLASLLAGLVIALLTVHLEGQWRPTGILVHFKR